MFSDLRSLKYLNLSFNDFSGEIPSEIFKNLTVLVELNLSGNNFHGNLPSSVSCMKQLESLKAYSNQFSGAVDRSMGELEELRLVNLSNNKYVLLYLRLTLSV